MSWDPIRFCQRHNIPYRDSGANVSAGNIVIKCPFCGTRDQGEHMSVSTRGQGFYCYRDNRHRGKSPVGLVMALLRISAEEARNLVGGGMHIPSDFKSRIHALLGASDPVEPRRLKLLPEFRPWTRGRVQRMRFENYLTSRGFVNLNRLYKLLEFFDMRYCIDGPFAERIVFPIRYEDILVNWTARAIGKTDLRYRTLSTDEEKSREARLPCAIGPITNYLLWYDECMDVDAKTLVVVEGPFDAFKVWYLGLRSGIVSTCLFTNSASDSQIELVEILSQRFKRTVLLLDDGAYHKALEIKRTKTFTPRALPGLNLELVKLPTGIKDPGQLDSLTFLEA